MIPLPFFERTAYGLAQPCLEVLQTALLQIHRIVIFLDAFDNLSGRLLLADVRLYHLHQGKQHYHYHHHDKPRQDFTPQPDVRLNKDTDAQGQDKAQPVQGRIELGRLHILIPQFLGCIQYELLMMLLPKLVEFSFFVFSPSSLLYTIYILKMLICVTFSISVFFIANLSQISEFSKLFLLFYCFLTAFNLHCPVTMPVAEYHWHSPLALPQEAARLSEDNRYLISRTYKLLTYDKEAPLYALCYEA